MTATDLQTVLAACAEREQRDLDDLCRLIAQPSISAQNIGVRECADLFVDVLTGAGFTAREWDELELVQDWTAFFDDPRRLLHHLLDE